MQESVAGSFTARATGFPADTFVLHKNGSVIGRLIFDGLRGARFVSGELEATLTRNPDGGYVIFSGNDRTLTAEPPVAGPRNAALNALEITCDGSIYRASISFLRNSARAFSGEGPETVLLRGGITGRKYEAVVDPADPAALPGAVLLLYHTATFRRRVFLA